MIDPELRDYLERARQETSAELAKMRQETSAEFAAVRSEMREGFDDMRRHFGAVIERIDGKTDLIVDMVLNVDQKLGRELGSVRSDMHDGFAETQNLIRFIAQQR